MRFLSIILITVLSISPCQAQGLDALKSKPLLDPNSEVQAYFEKGKWLMYKVYDFSELLPGVDPYGMGIFDRICEFDNLTVTPVLDNDEVYRNEIARIYSRKFNSLMLAEIKKTNKWASLFRDWEHLNSKVGHQVAFNGRSDEFINMINKQYSKGVLITFGGGGKEVYACRFEEDVTWMELIESFSVECEMVLGLDGDGAVVLRGIVEQER